MVRGIYMNGGREDDMGGEGVGWSKERGGREVEAVVGGGEVER